MIRDVRISDTMKVSGVRCQLSVDVFLYFCILHYEERHVVGPLTLRLSQPGETEQTGGLAQQLADRPHGFQSPVGRGLDQHLVVGRLQHWSVGLQVTCTGWSVWRS